MFDCISYKCVKSVGNTGPTLLFSTEIPDCSERGFENLVSTYYYYCSVLREDVLISSYAFASTTFCLVILT